MFKMDNQSGDGDRESRRILCPAGCGWIDRNSFPEHVTLHVIRLLMKIMLLRIRRIEEMLSLFEPMLTSLHGELSRVIARLEQEQEGTRTATQDVHHLQERRATLENTVMQQELQISRLYARTQALESTPCREQLIWKIGDVFFKLDEARQGRYTSLKSPPFTTRDGYKLSARLYLNGTGTGQGTHLSLFFVIMTGDHDALQQWPFRRCVTFWLVNQNGQNHLIRTFQPDLSSPSFQGPTFNNNNQEGFEQFVPLSTLIDPMQGFVIDDTIFIKIEAE